MAATFASQIRREWRWQEIRDAIDNVVAIVRDWYEEEDGNLASSPTSGWDVRHLGIAANASYDEGEDTIVSTVYFGTVMNIVPSGKFYAPWSAVSGAVRDRDARWWEALEQVAASFGLSVVSGEGDPTDVFVVRYDSINDPADLALLPDDIGAK